MEKIYTDHYYKSKKKLESLSLIFVSIAMFLIFLLKIENNIIKTILMSIPLFLMYYSISEILLIIKSSKIPIVIDRENGKITFPGYYNTSDINIVDIDYILSTAKKKAKVKVGENYKYTEPPYMIDFMKKSEKKDKSIGYMMLELYSINDRKKIFKILTEDIHIEVVHD